MSHSPEGSPNLQKRARRAMPRIFNLRALRFGWHLGGRAAGAQDMFGQSDPRDEYQPLGYMGQVPLYVTTLLVIGYVAAMVALVFVKAGGYLVYDTDSVLHNWQLWRFFTYPLVNGPSIWFAVEMYFLYRFGRDVEQFIGRTSYAVLYLSLVVLGPCILTAVGTWQYAGLAGSGTVNFALFIAFCTIYPNVEIFWTFKAKWIALVILGINSLEYLDAHATIELLVFWATCLAAFLFIKYLRGHIQIQIPWRNFFRQRRSRRNLRAMPSPRIEPREKPVAPREDVLESIDPLLDKIAKHGIGSLTAREREQLERARAELLKKPGP